MLKIAIIEDEVPAYNRLKKLIEETEPDANVNYHADSIVSAVELFKNHNEDIDIAFFDIELADGQSFEIFKRVNVNCPVIFTTAYDEFALKAFKLNSIDYLLKPIEKTELKNAIYKFKQFYQLGLNKAVESNINKLLQQINKSNRQNFKSRFLVKLGEKLIPVSVDDIAYFYSKDKLTHIVTHQKNIYISDYTIEQLSNIIEPQKFFQLNRQIISSLAAIKQINNYFNGKLKIILNPAYEEEVLVSRERAPFFKQWLNGE
ncbi:MAG: LytR/AlgR family response regulator transcription factor [Bacteroidia bacterium]